MFTLTIGVEWRALDDAELAANYRGDAMEEMETMGGPGLHIDDVRKV